MFFIYLIKVFLGSITFGRLDKFLQINPDKNRKYKTLEYLTSDYRQLIVGIKVLISP